MVYCTLHITEYILIAFQSFNVWSAQEFPNMYTEVEILGLVQAEK